MGSSSSATGAPGSRPTGREALEPGALGLALMTASPDTTNARTPLPADDPGLFELDLRGLRRQMGGSSRAAGDER